MLETLEFAATLACLIFTGAAVYITFVEHPARMTCATPCALSQWAPSYQRATVMQASLAVISAACGLLAFWRGAGVGWLVGGAVIFAVVPTTLFVIMPTNKRLMALDRSADSQEARDSLARWGRLHAIRSGLSVVASLVFLSLLVRGHVPAA